MDAVKIMAKDLVRTRRYVKKFMLMRANIQAVSLKIQTLKSQNAMAQAMKVIGKTIEKNHGCRSGSAFFFLSIFPFGFRSRKEKLKKKKRYLVIKIVIQIFFSKFGDNHSKGHF